MHHDDWFTLAELTERLGGLVWVEEQMASLLQGWAAVESVAPVAVHFATSGRHHAWHAQVIRECLPTSPRLREVEPERSPTAGWEQAMTMLHNMTDIDATVPRLKALNKVLHPWLDREIGALSDLGRPVSDAPLMRWLRFVSLDHHDDGSAANSLLSSRVTSAVSVEDHRLIASLDLLATS